MPSPSPAVTATLLTWVVVSAVLTALLRLRSDDEWIAVATRSPRLAGLIGFVRALGIDPVGAIAALRRIVSGGPVCPPPSPSPAPETPRTGLADPKATERAPAPSPGAWVTWVGATALALAAVGCAALPGACQTIDTLQKACTVLIVRGPDGTRREVRVTADELEAFGQRALARESVDAGAP